MIVQLKEKLAACFVWGAALLTLGALVIIIGYIMIQGLDRLGISFLLENPRRMGSEGGVFSPLLGTIYFTLVTMLLAIPIGVGAAIYLTEFTAEGLLVRVIRFFTDALAGIPSIVIGLFGFAFFVVILRPLTGGWSIISASLTAFCMILPIMIRVSEEALHAIPASIREGSLALGVSKWDTVLHVVLPGALPGILTAALLGTGRVIGETAPLLLTLGGSLLVPKSIFSSGRTLSMHLYLVAMETGEFSIAFATATVLVIVILLLNLGGYYLMRILGRRIRGA
ncbi:MAG TPA: phosphate ABC transporter permease PstA [Syntrophaceticus sp.]|nr:phosphate ABC transporter permease PstA [Syntrophaceticus sp.]